MRRVGDTRPFICHNMIEPLIERWIAKDKKGARRKVVDRTEFTERR